MATILQKRYSAKDSTADILRAIHTLAADKHGRVLMHEHVEWLETKLKEITRLSRIVLKREDADD